MEGKKYLYYGAIISALALFVVAFVVVSVDRNKPALETGQPSISESFKSDLVADESYPQGGMLNLKSFGFPKLKIEKTEFKPQVPDYELAVDELKNLKKFPEKFSAEQLGSLPGNGFFIAKNTDKFYNSDPAQEIVATPSFRMDDMNDLYVRIGGSYAAELRKPENAVFITSDWTLHTFHKLLAKEIEYIEQHNFYPDLLSISRSMLRRSLGEYAKAGDQEKKDSYGRISAFFLVPTVVMETVEKQSKGTQESMVVLDSDGDSAERVMAQLATYKEKVPQPIYDVAQKELEYVMAAEKVVGSPLFYELKAEAGLDENEDYTQYTPRSHYNKNPVLRAYFRAMMWYGRSSFVVKSEKLTRDAMNITLMMKDDEKATELWKRIYNTTSFLVGASDDLGLEDYGKAIASLQSQGKAVDGALVGDLQKEIATYEGPKIMSSAFSGDKVTQLSKEELQAKTKGFRFMGQRFVADAFVFSTLTQGDEKPDPKFGQKLPSSTTALAVMTTLGSAKAEQFLGDWVKENAPESKEIINDRVAKLKAYFASLSEEAWGQNVYWSWLHTLKPLLSSFPQGYPMFCRNEAWDRKDLQSALGSWTELKHDTLLYAKQSYAEMGGGGPEGEIPPVPKGYVEPNVEFYDRLIALAQLSKDGLEQQQLLDSMFLDRNETLIAELKFIRDMAVKEVQNEKIRDEDFEKLRLTGRRMGWVISKLPDETVFEKDARSALVADVHTDAANQEILYEATGIPNYIYVAIKDVNGVRLTKGVVYNYYEFKKPLEKRLNDETWQEWNYAEKQDNVPGNPSWMAPVLQGSINSGAEYNDQD